MKLQIARADLMASDPQVPIRTWQFVMDEIIKTRIGAPRVRWERAIRDKAFDLIRNRPILETRSKHSLKRHESPN